jgi:hypothetical protein
MEDRMLPRRRRIAGNSPEAVFGSNLRRLRKRLDRSADKLIPLLAKLAWKHRAREEVDARARRQTAKAHVKAMNGLESLVGKLFVTLDSARKQSGSAVLLGYVPVPQPSGTFGQLAAAMALEQSLKSLRDAAVVVKERAAEWRRRAEAEAAVKFTRGRNIGERQRIANLIALEFDAAGLRPTTTVGGVLEETLSIVYAAAGIRVPADLRHDTTAAVAHVRRSHPH